MQTATIAGWLAACVGALAAYPARADVIDSAAHGFTVRHEVTVDAERGTVYRAAVDSIGRWWSSDYTVSGDAANLYITMGMPGCFCETLGDGAGLVHMVVSFVSPGRLLRMTGGLGPLGLMGVAGNMTLEFDDAADATVVTLQYAVGGYMPGGLDEIAPVVDGVLKEALQRLESFVETGSAGEG